MRLFSDRSFHWTRYSLASTQWQHVDQQETPDWTRNQRRRNCVVTSRMVTVVLVNTVSIPVVAVTLVVFITIVLCSTSSIRVTSVKSVNVSFTSLKTGAGVQQWISTDCGHCSVNAPKRSTMAKKLPSYPWSMSFDQVTSKSWAKVFYRNNPWSSRLNSSPAKLKKRSRLPAVPVFSSLEWSLVSSDWKRKNFVVIIIIFVCFLIWLLVCFFFRSTYKDLWRQTNCTTSRLSFDSVQQEEFSSFHALQICVKWTKRTMKHSKQQ